MLRKVLMFDNELEQKFTVGLNKIAAAVKSTLGPGGNPVIIQRPNMSPLITKDGVTVAQHVRPSDPFEELISQAVIEIAEKTNQTAGDGTTTAVVLAEAIYELGKAYLNETSGKSNAILVRQILSGVNKVTAELDKMKKEVTSIDDTLNVATISANGDREIGSLISDAIDKVGNDGVITVEEGNTWEHTLNIEEGTHIERGYLSDKFITDKARQRCELVNPVIIICNDVIRDMQSMLPLLQQIVKENKQFLLICDDLEGQAKAFMDLNASQGALRGAAIKSPAAGATRVSYLEDLAVLTGTRVYSQKTGQLIKEAKVVDLGTARKVVISRNKTIIIDGGGSTELLTSRISELKEHHELAPTQYDKDNIATRIARLTGGVAIIGVGAATELEMKEKRDRIEDALNATRAAIKDGIVPGGGTALFASKKVLSEDIPGEAILLRALEAPFRQIVKNTGLNPDEKVEELLVSKKNHGYDASTFEFKNLLKAGIIDPTQVVKQALINASSIATLLLTSRCAIAIDTEDMKKHEDDMKL